MMWILIRLAALLYGSAAIAVIAVAAAAAAMSPERLPQWEMLSLETFPPRGKSRWHLDISPQEPHKYKKEEKEPLDEDQLFVAELAQDLGRVCQVQRHYGLRTILIVRGKLSGLSPTWDFLLCRCCRGLKSWSTSGSRMTSGPLLFARPSSCSGPPCWRARCFWGDSIEQKTKKKLYIIFICTWGFLSVMLRSVCAEEAHADRWLARAWWRQTWRGVQRTRPAPGQNCHPKLGQGPESSAWGRMYICL